MSRSRFTIRWDDASGQYKVSIPELKSADVVTVDYYNDLILECLTELDKIADSGPFGVGKKIKAAREFLQSKFIR